MGMTERLEEAQFAVEVAEAAVEEWITVSDGFCGTLDAFALLEANLCQARGVLVAIQRRQAAVKPGDGDVAAKVGQ